MSATDETTAGVSIPADLRALPNWVVWRFEPNGHGHPTKVPYCAAQPARKADSTDPATWSDFATARKAATLPGIDGIGVVVSGDDPYCGVDLDDCVTGDTVHEAAQRMVERLGSYTEVTPSGIGLRVLVRAVKPGSGCKRKASWGGSVEIYDHARFFTVTGRHLPGTPAVVEDRQGELDALYHETFPATQASAAPPTTARVVSDDDHDLIERAHAAADGAKFGALWRGDTSLHDDDRSRADLALCNLLAFWTGCDLSLIHI